MQKDWDRFFDERYFTKWFPRDVAAETERAVYDAMSLAGCSVGSYVLDAPCGFGRHAMALSQLGYRVTGADRSAALIDQARALSVELENQPAWVVADYRDLPFDDRSFDCVLNLHTSLGFDAGSGDAAALTEFHRVLRPGGRLVVEINHRELFLASFQSRSEEPFGERGKLIIEREFDHTTGVNRMRHTHVEGGDTETLTMEMRIYRPDELEDLLKGAGFADLQRFGSLAGGEFTPSSRLVLLASRQAIA